MSVEDKKIKARDEFVHYAQTLEKRDLGEIGQARLSIAFIKWYVEKIYNRLQLEIADDDIEQGMVDGKQDLGVDFLHREDGKVLIVQAKYRKRGAHEEPATIAEFQSILERISNPALTANRRLEEKLNEIDFENDSFTLVFVTLGDFSDELTKRMSVEPNYPSKFKDLRERCVWEFLDERRLNEAYRNALAFTQGVSDKQISIYPVGIKNQKGKSLIEVVSGEHKSYITALDAWQIVNAYKHLGGDAIFTLNIRGYIGRSNKNRAILATATQHPEDFFLFNNGISCLCTKIELKEDRLEVRGLQVINGAQTVRSLVMASRSRRGINPWPDGGAPIILTRITEIADGYGKGGKLREDITKSNNTQNVIKDADFRSNDPIQLNLAGQFGELTRGDRKVVYIAKRTDQRQDSKRVEVIKIKEFAKIVYAFLEDQVSYSESVSFLFDDSETGGYCCVFGDGKSVPDQMPIEEFKLKAAIYWVGAAIAAQLKAELQDESLDPDARATLERKWAYIYAARCVLQMHFSDDDWKSQLRKLYKGDWTFGVDMRGKWVESIYRVASSGVKLCLQTDRQITPKFSYRGWMRNPETPHHIKRTLVTIKNLQPITRLP